MGMSATMCAKRAGITYRQLDFWTRSGYITMTRSAAGSGSQRVFSESEVAVVKRLAMLVRAGVSPLAASQAIANNPGQFVFQLTPEVTVILKESA